MKNMAVCCACECSLICETSPIVVEELFVNPDGNVYAVFRSNAIEAGVRLEVHADCEMVTEARRLGWLKKNDEKNNFG